MAYNICGDHLHLLLVCKKEHLSKIVKVKAVTSRKYNIARGITVSTKKQDALSEESKEKLQFFVDTKIWLQRNKKRNPALEHCSVYKK